jgi:formate-dependent nitrite reductase cytochrome c552 subunit
MDAKEDVRAVLAFLRGLVSRPESLVAIKLRDTQDIVVVERGAGNEGDWVAVRLTHERRTVLGELRSGQIRWQTAVRSRHIGLEACQVLGRVLSVIHPVQAHVQPQAA